MESPSFYSVTFINYRVGKEGTLLSFYYFLQEPLLLTKRPGLTPMCSRRDSLEREVRWEGQWTPAYELPLERELPGQPSQCISSLAD